MTQQFFPPVSLLRVISFNRFVRGILQGFMLARFLPEAHRLGWSMASAGILLSASLLIDFCLTLLIGHQSDRRSPTVLLMAGECCSSGAGLLFLLFPDPFFLGLAVLAAGAGQRSNGSPGPWAPAEQALLSRYGSRKNPFSVFSHNTSWGLWGMGAGATFGATHLWQATSHPLDTFRFAMSGLVTTSLLNLAALLYHGQEATALMPPPVQGETGFLSKREKTNLTAMVFSTLFYGLSIGLSDAMIAYWFVLKFKATPDHISFLLALSFLLSGVVAWFLGQVKKKRVAPVYVLLQMAGLAGLAFLPSSASIEAAGAFYTLRMTSVRAPGGIRQALATQLVRPGRLGWAAGLHFSSLHLLQVAGPALTGYCWEKHRTGTPLVLAVACMAVSFLFTLFLYARTVLERTPSTEGIPDVQNHPHRVTSFETRRSEDASQRF
jgi:hypothetical protein